MDFVYNLQELQVEAAGLITDVFLSRLFSLVLLNLIHSFTSTSRPILGQDLGKVKKYYLTRTEPKITFRSQSSS
ncbi:MAG: hypothetical protein A2338_02510 [Bacteroidetes bacterium RIFOXYB12_FULL_41_6]|nr:MAG: hypothetical protein A2338_02510 [Bacteroidetes bacterium RIFOXYB12_FULL_41_6]